jgi:parallel beta-helix repeat protein
MGNEFGIELSYTSNVIVADNTIVDVGSLLAMNGVLYAGIYVEGGSSNIITGNNVERCMNGMAFDDTSYNLIVGNNITGSYSFGTDSKGILFGLFGKASNNTVYHNNFINNIGGQAVDSDSVNVWDNGYPSGGNYWSDYNAKEIDNSGIGSTPYVIDAQNKDRYPLMKPFNGAFYALQTAPPKISVLSPLNQTYNETSVPLVFTVDKQVNWTGYSLDGKQNVTVTGNCTIANVTNGVHSITVYANDTYGNMGASEIVTFTVAKPEPFPTTLVIAPIASVVVGVGLLVYFKKRKH